MLGRNLWPQGLQDDAARGIVRLSAQVSTDKVVRQLLHEGDSSRLPQLL
jgi:hypothetical protein